MNCGFGEAYALVRQINACLRQGASLANLEQLGALHEREWQQRMGLQVSHGQRAGAPRGSLSSVDASRQRCPHRAADTCAPTGSTRPRAPLSATRCRRAPSLGTTRAPYLDMNSQSLRVRDVMTKDVTTIGRNETLLVADDISDWGVFGTLPSSTKTAPWRESSANATCSIAGYYGRSAMERTPSNKPCNCWS